MCTLECLLIRAFSQMTKNPNNNFAEDNGSNKRSKQVSCSVAISTRSSKTPMDSASNLNRSNGIELSTTASRWTRSILNVPSIKKNHTALTTLKSPRKIIVANTALNRNIIVDNAKNGSNV